MMTVREVERVGLHWRLVRQWPTFAAIALAALTAGASGAEAAPIVTASGFVYLGAAAVGRRGAAWPMFGISFVLITIGRLTGAVEPSWLMVAGAAALLGYGVAAGTAMRSPRDLLLQTGAMVVLATAALVATQANATAAGLLVAGGLLAHASWDVRHHRTGRVVTRSLAHFCGVLDILLGAAVLVVTFA